jgi:hypothetical protein
MKTPSMKKTSSANSTNADAASTSTAKAATAQAECLCRAVRMEIDFPAFWAWHDHSPASRRAHGAAYATYVGSWKSRFRVTAGASNITHFEDAETNTVRHFCSRCGTPVYYERGHSPKMVNIPRALLLTRIGREPRYHIGIEDGPDWAYFGESLGPLKGYPGVVWNRGKRGGSKL